MSQNLSKYQHPQINAEVVPSEKFATTLHSLRISEDYEALVDVKHVVTEVVVGKPNRQTFFRVHREWKAVYPILELKTGMKSEFFIVSPSAATEIEEDVHPRLLVPLITRDGWLFIWPLRFTNGERQLDAAATSSLAAMQVAKQSWTKLVWTGSSFSTRAAKKDLPEPEWPEIDFDQLLELAFKDRIIETSEHPVIKQLIGAE